VEKGGRLLQEQPVYQCERKAEERGNPPGQPHPRPLSKREGSLTIEEKKFL
jgi:hypothetical protein